MLVSARPTTQKQLSGFNLRAELVLTEKGSTAVTVARTSHAGLQTEGGDAKSRPAKQGLSRRS